jgi:DNA-binding LacI/PurR family transcriptional regulator
MEDIAREAGVSRALVSVAYRGAAGVSDATRERILETGRRLDYTPNRAAALLAGRGGNTIGVFLQDLHNDLFADIYDGIRSVTDVEGRHLVLAVGTLDGTGDRAALSALEQSRVDVIIAAGLQLADPDAVVVNSRVPLVSVARAIDGVDSVSSDNRTGAARATTHLVELGHRAIVFLANPQSDGYRDRRAGYEQAMRAASLAPHVVGTTYARADAAQNAGELLDSAAPPTAIYAHNDQAAFGVLEALAVRGLVAGRDVSVVGHDNSSMSRAAGTGLTTIDINGVKLGRDAALLATRRLNESTAEAKMQNSVPSLVIRTTTGPPK